MSDSQTLASASSLEVPSSPNPILPTRSMQRMPRPGVWGAGADESQRTESAAAFRQAMSVDALAIHALQQDAPIASELAAAGWNPWMPNLSPLAFELSATTLLQFRSASQKAKGTEKTNWANAQELFLRCCTEGKLQFWDSVEETFPRAIIDRSKALKMAWVSVLQYATPSGIALLLERTQHPLLDRHQLPHASIYDVRVWDGFFRRSDVDEAFRAFWPDTLPFEAALGQWQKMHGLLRLGVLQQAPSANAVAVLERVRSWCARILEKEPEQFSRGAEATQTLEQLWALALEIIQPTAEEPEHFQPQQRPSTSASSNPARRRQPVIDWMMDVMAQHHRPLILALEEKSRKAFVANRGSSFRNRLKGSNSKQSALFLSTVADTVQQKGALNPLWIQGFSLDEPRLLELSEQLLGSFLPAFEPGALQEHLLDVPTLCLTVPNPHPMLFKREEIRAKTGRRDVMDPAFERMKQRLHSLAFISEPTRQQLLAVLDYADLPPPGAVPTWMPADKPQALAPIQLSLSLESVLWCLPVGARPNLFQWMTQQEPLNRAAAAHRWESARQLWRGRLLPREPQTELHRQYEASWERAQLFAHLQPSEQKSNRIDPESQGDDVVDAASVSSSARGGPVRRPRHRL